MSPSDTPGDMPAQGVLTFVKAQLREHGVSTSADALLPVLRSVLERPSHGFIIAASCQSTAVGVAYAACILSVEYGGLSGWMDALYVLPAWRGRGVGSRLLQRVLDLAEERGWKALDLEWMRFTSGPLLSTGVFTSSQFSGQDWPTASIADRAALTPPANRQDSLGSM